MNDLEHNRAISDLYLISALVAYGVRPLRIDRSKPKRQKFIFNSDIPIMVVTQSSDGATQWGALSLDEIETHFLSKSLYFPGNYPETLKEIRATIHGYIEDMEE